MFDALLRMQLGPIVERLAEMESQLEDLYRRAESFCRIGICQQVDAASNTCKVSHGDLLTPAIRFSTPAPVRKPKPVSPRWVNNACCSTTAGARAVCNPWLCSALTVIAFRRFPALRR